VTSTDRDVFLAFYAVIAVWAFVAAVRLMA
jgi:hypothetical protein